MEKVILTNYLPLNYELHQRLSQIQEEIVVEEETCRRVHSPLNNKLATEEVTIPRVVLLLENLPSMAGETNYKSKRFPINILDFKLFITKVNIFHCYNYNYAYIYWYSPLCRPE